MSLTTAIALHGRKCFYLLNIIRLWQQFCKALLHSRGEKTCLDKFKIWLR